jgi:ribose 5-phosphate isomerase B
LKLSFASDHAGYEFKSILIDTVKGLGHTVVDHGTNSSQSVDYPDHIKLAAKDVSDGNADKAIIICGTGIGASITANKIKGIRCALCTNIMTTKYSRLHNDANVFAVGSRVTSIDDAIEMLKIWLTTEFEGGRHKRRIDKISELE